MAAGHLRSRVAFAMRPEQTDGYGNTQGAFVEQFVVAAQIVPRLGGEAVMAARLTGSQPVTIRVRQSADTRQVTPEWRASDARKGVLYNIRAIVDPDEGRAGAGTWFDMLCEAGVAT